MNDLTFKFLDISDLSIISRLLNKEWLNEHGANSIYYSIDYMEDLFHSIYFEDRCSFGVYNKSKKLVAAISTFKTPIYYSKLKKTYNNLFTSLLVVDSCYLNNHLAYEILKRNFTSAFKVSYDQIIAIVLSTSKVTRLLEKALFDSLKRKIIISTQFNIKYLVKKKFIQLNNDLEIYNSLNIYPVEKRMLDNYINFFNEIKLKTVCCVDYTNKLWEYILFGMKTKKSWHCIYNNKLTAIMIANIHRTMKNERKNAYVEFFILQNVDERVTKEIIYKFLELLFSEVNINEIFIQNSTYLDRFLLKNMSFATTLSRYNIIINPLKEDFNFDIDFSSWILPVF